MIPEISQAAVLALLRRFGYLPNLGRAPYASEVDRAVDRYQQFFALSSPSSVAQHLALPRCGVKDPPLVQTLAAPVCRWGHPTVRVDFGFKVGKLSDVQVASAFHWALDRWASVSGFRWGLDAVGPNIKSRAGKVDGPGNILAWSELPCGASEGTQLQQLYDNNDPGLTQSLEYFRAVVLHELGHALGLEHSNDPRSIMYPIMRSDVLDLGGDDLGNIQARYPVKVVPKPIPQPTPPPPPAKLTGTVQVGGNTYRITGELVDS